MPRPKPAISDATRSKIRRAVLDSPYPLTARQVRETVGVSDATTRAVLTELVESDDLTIDRDYSPIRYRRRGDKSLHAQAWHTLYRMILDRCQGDWMTTGIADELARSVVEMIEGSGEAPALLADETREQVESAGAKTKRK